MKLGSGIKNKMLQAWALATPVVASLESLGGLDASDGVNLMIRDTLDSFAAAVAALTRDPALSRSIASAGRETASAEYAWTKHSEELEALICGAVDRLESP